VGKFKQVSEVRISREKYPRDKRKLTMEYRVLLGRTEGPFEVFSHKFTVKMH
jgi:hypothetical protein